MQIEINRALYMDERTLERSAHFARLAADLGAGEPAWRIPLEELRPYRRGSRIEKRAARGCKRPKSREETPKEGNGRYRYRTAIIYTATHKNQAPKRFFHASLHRSKC